MKNKKMSFEEEMELLDEYEEKYSNHSFKNIEVFIPEVTSNNKQEDKNKHPYEIIDNTTAKINNKVFTKKQLKTYSIIFFTFSIILFILGIFFLPIILLGLIFLYPAFLYRKIYKEIEKYN